MAWITEEGIHNVYAFVICLSVLAVYDGIICTLGYTGGEAPLGYVHLRGAPIYSIASVSVSTTRRTHILADPTQLLMLYGAVWWSAALPSWC